MPNKRYFGPEDIYKLNIPNNPRISPCGDKVAFVVQSWDKNKNKSITNIKLMKTDGSCQRTLTTGCCDKFPRWSPSGERLAFISSRSGKAQVWIIDMRGGEPWMIKTSHEVTSPPVWSPDGKYITFLAVKNIEEKENQKNDIKVIDKFYHKYDGYGFFGDKNQHIFIGQVKDPADIHSVQQLSSGSLNHLAPTWSPSGNHIACAVIKEDQMEKGVFKHDIIKYDINTRQKKTLFASEGPVRSLKWSPDGNYLAFIGHQNQYGRATTNGIWLLPLHNEKTSGPHSKEIIHLTEKLDRPVGESIDSDIKYCCEKIVPLQFSADSQKIYFLAADKGSSFIYSVSTDKKQNINKIIGKNGETIHAFSNSDNSFCYTISRHNSPREIYFNDFTNKLKLTGLNERLKKEIFLFPAQKIEYEGTSQKTIDGWVVNPSTKKENGKNPLVLIVHGGPHLAYGNNFMLQSQVLAGKGYTVLYTNPQGSQSYGQDFASAVVKDWGRNDYLDIINGIEEVIKRKLADDNNIGVTGWSYGGFMSIWLAAHTDYFKAAVVGGSVTNLYSFYGTSDIGYSFGEFETGGTSCHAKDRLISRSPINYVNNIDIPILILHGENDLRCPISQSEELFTALKRCNKKTVLVRYPDEPHILQKPNHIVDRLQRMVEWFNEHL